MIMIIKIILRPRTNPKTFIMFFCGWIYSICSSHI